MPSFASAVAIGEKRADRRPGTVPLTVAICSNRVSCLQDYLLDNLISLQADDDAVVVVDTPAQRCDDAFFQMLREIGVRLFFNQETRGVAYCRNAALRAARYPHILFLDDDVSIKRAATDAIRLAFTQGAHVVGARLQAPPGSRQFPFYVSEGQFHYLGLHNPLVPSIKPWGACLGIDGNFARVHSIVFREELGRKGTRLFCGEDTSFVEEMITRGANQVALDSVGVFHNVLPGRKTLRYVLRRAFWQGRSEIRRSQFLRAVAKEYRRNMTSRSLLSTRLILTSLVLFTYFLGGIREVSSRLPSRRGS